MKGYLTAKQVAKLWDITDRSVQTLCKTSRITRSERAETTYLTALVSKWAAERGISVRLSDYESA